MRDVARVVGVSQSTVSRILNDVPLLVPVAADTRQRVHEAARRLGYRPNPLARALRGARMMLLGVVVRDITDPFFASAIEALSESARSRGYNIVLGHARGLAEEAIALAAVLESRHCDAIILLGDVSDQPRLVADLSELDIPVVALWQGPTPHLLHSVNVDNRAGVRLALDHLFELGHRRIAFVEGRRLGDIRERRLAFVSHAHHLGLEVPPAYIEHGLNTPDAGEAAIRSLIALPEPPTAIVAATDVLAFGVLHAAHELGIRVPADLSVVGFDDIPIAQHTVPALTTVRMPIAEMVAAAVELAVAEPTGARDAPPVVADHPSGVAVDAAASLAEADPDPTGATAPSDLASGDAGPTPRGARSRARIFRPELIVRSSTAGPSGG
jgi:DNA-binding LacI/PurR family transcriptional regulator